MAYVVMPYAGMAYVGMAYAVTAYVLTASTVMADILMARAVFTSAHALWSRMTAMHTHIHISMHMHMSMSTKVPTPLSRVKPALGGAGCSTVSGGSAWNILEHCHLLAQNSLEHSNSQPRTFQNFPTPLA